MSAARVLRVIALIFALGLSMLGASTSAKADDTSLAMGGGGLPPGTPEPPTTPAPNSATGATYRPGEIGKGNTSALSKITSIFTAVITTAVSASQLVKPEA